ncbi:MAG: hypothetical protein JNL67_12770 [Planctomycetaceae bacterium]|nr:hypothetical protein [Planctomycetaceae bacterium]
MFGPSVEALRGYSVHLNDRSAARGQHYLPTNRQLQSAKFTTVSRKFRRVAAFDVRIQLAESSSNDHAKPRRRKDVQPSSFAALRLCVRYAFTATWEHYDR